MYEFVQAAGSSFYMDCPSRIGMVKIGENRVILVDSGSGKDAARKARQILDKEKWSLSAIFITHAHADHIGGCQYLQSLTGCKIYAPGIEAAFTRFPILEPISLCAGSPPDCLKTRFFLAKEGDCLPLTEDVLPEGMSLIPLPGHSPAMVGLRTADDTVYLGDGLCGEDALSKYPVPFLYDVGDYLRSLEKIKGLTAARFVPAHAPVCEDIAPLAEKNIRHTLSVGEEILHICHTPVAEETVIQKVFQLYHLTMTPDQYYLVGSTLRSFLTWHQREGRMEVFFEDNRMYLHTL